MKPYESPRISKKSILVDSGDSWPVWNRGITRNETVWRMHTNNVKRVYCQGFPFKKIFRGHCDPRVVDFGGHFQFERVTY